MSLWDSFMPVGFPCTLWFVVLTKLRNAATHDHTKLQVYLEKENGNMKTTPRIFLYVNSVIPCDIAFTFRFYGVFTLTLNNIISP